AGLRLATSEKGKQAAKASKAKSLSALSENDEGNDGDDDGKEGDGDDDDEDDDGEEGNDDDDQEVERDDEKDDEKEGKKDTMKRKMKMNYKETSILIKEGYVGAVSAILGIVHRYIDQQINEAVQVAVQLQSDKLREEAQKENDEFLKTIDENMKKISSSKSKNKSRNLYKALVEAYKSDKIILDTYGETVTLKRRRDDDADKDEEPSARPDRGSKRLREGKEPESASALTKTATRSAGKSTQGTKSRQASASESATAEEPMQTTFQMEEPSHPENYQLWIVIGIRRCRLPTETFNRGWELAKQTDSRSSFNELMDTPLDFSNFLINRLKVDTLTSELIAGPTYELLKGSCKSLVELEYHLEEVYKATTDQLDSVNLEGQQYPHNLLKPLPLIPNNRGRRIIPFDHFINNDLAYLRGDLVPRTMWIEEPIGYDKHALWGVSHWGRKRQQFYGFAVNRESARDVYSKRRIIAVTELKIVEWHNYKHLDWITVRRDDDKLYKFKEGDFKRLQIQDIKDMLLLLVQGKLTNLTVEERFAFNNKDKKNRLMRIDELHKFGDGTLVDVRTALDDRLKGIWMQYLP
nr:hypothetical protein [Tanacetum cinerariifolium]